MSIQLGKYRASTKEAAKFGASYPVVDEGTEGTFILTGLNPFGQPWGLFTTDGGFTYNAPLSSLEVDFNSCTEPQWYARKEMDA